MKFKDLYNEALLQEGPVPFAKIEQIKTKMAQQHSIPDGTFGVEYEYLPDTRNQVPDTEDIIDALNSSWSRGYNQPLEDEYNTWLDNERSDIARQWLRYGSQDIDQYDQSYGPMSIETFDNTIHEPKQSDYDSEEDYEKALSDYNDKRSEIEHDYSHWERKESYDYTDDFFEYLADNNWEDFVEIEPQSDPETECTEAINLLSKHVAIKRDDRYDPNMWTVGEDGPNIEIRSPILKKENMDQVDLVSAFVDHQITDSGTGLHIHIGVPKDFDAFDLLAMTTLVDEGQVEKDLKASKVRRDLGFARLRDEVSKNLINVISRSKYGGQFIKTPFVISNNELLTLINLADRYAGTNIKAFAKYKTVEFRYFGAHNTNVLPKWINYFLQLPPIAQKRNRITLRSPSTSQKLYAIRLPGGKTQIQLTDYSERPEIKPTGLPALELKKTKEPPSLKDKYKKP